MWSMRKIKCLGVVSFLSIADGCHNGPPTNPLKLTDGCYYIDSQPFLRIKGNEGTFLVSGNIRLTHVETSGDEYGRYVTFSPGFIDYNGNVDSYDAIRQITYPMKAHTKVPTVMVNLAAAGETEMELGKPC